MALVDIKDMYKIYEVGSEKVHALDGVNLKIEEKEFVAIVGPSGSGKSTLMNMLGCLDVPTTGTYLLDNEDVSRLTDSQLARIRNRKIGFIFQQFNLFQKMSALDNVERPLKYKKIRKQERIEMTKKALEKVGLGDRMHHKPNELSGGQQQRVAIARALVGNPPVLLADEPTGNLDSKSSVEIMRMIKELHDAGNTIILITHEHDIAKEADRIIQMSDGKIVSDTRSEDMPDLDSIGKGSKYEDS
jgi:putative ABC transport system ATP-binding protein